MASTIKVDTIENVAGSGNVSLGSGHNLVVPGDLTVDTSTLKVDSTNNSVGIGTSSPSTSHKLTLDHTSNYGGISLKQSGTQVGQIIQEGGTGNIYVDADSGSLGGGLIFRTTGGTTRMNIDGSGRVLMPYQPRFQAYNSSTVSFSALSDAQVVDFDATTINVGSHYSTSTHLFTAPIAGTYWFGVTIRVDNVGTTGGDYFHPFLGKNGSTVLSGSLNGRMIVTAETQNIFSHLSGTWLVDLSANDTIGFYHGDGQSAGANAGSGYYQGGQCNFAGYLLG